MEFGEMKRNTSNWSNFCIFLIRAGLSASAGLPCFGISEGLMNRLQSVQNAAALALELDVQTT